MRLPSPMLARSGPLPNNPGWTFELKYDGFRAIVRTGENYTVRSRILGDAQPDPLAWPRYPLGLGRGERLLLLRGQPQRGNLDRPFAAASDVLGRVDCPRRGRHSTRLRKQDPARGRRWRGGCRGRPTT